MWGLPAWDTGMRQRDFYVCRRGGSVLFRSVVLFLCLFVVVFGRGGGGVGFMDLGSLMEPT